MIKCFKLLFVIVANLAIMSCKNDIYDPIDDSIIGSWYGTRSYYNPVGGTKYQYLTVTLESNKTGTLEYESPVSYSVAKFVYEVRGGKIHCNGAYASSYGDIESDFSMTLSIEGNRLIPTDKYNYFILTRDNSVMTDGDGKEINDQSYLLEQVWINTTGKSIIVFDKSAFTEYVLSAPFSKSYSSYSEGTYRYDPARKIINIDGVQFDILLLSTTYLSLRNQFNGDIFNYDIGSRPDIPISEEELYTGSIGGHEWVDIGLPSHTKWATMNIGASKETDPGNYYAWGETPLKTLFTEENYKFFNNGIYSVYVGKNEPKDAKGIIILKDEDNAACVLWGKSWDMPTSAQMKELVDYCQVTYNDQFLTMTGPNGRSIIFPLGGYKYDNNLIWNKGMDGYWMSKELEYGGPSWPKTWCPILLSGYYNSDAYFPASIYISSYYRDKGFNIRPVLKN